MDALAGLGPDGVAHMLHSDPQATCDEAEQHFGDKWEVLDIIQRLGILDFVLEREAKDMAIAPEDLEAVWLRLLRRTVLCQRTALVWRHGARCRLCSFREPHPQHRRRGLAIHRARPCIGEGKPTPQVSQVRVLAPMAPLVSICDAVLSTRVAEFFEREVHRDGGVFIAVRKGAQVLDVALGMSMAVKRMLDNRSQGAIGQADIAAFFDYLNILGIARDMDSAGPRPQPWFVCNGCLGCESPLAKPRLASSTVPEAV